MLKLFGEAVIPVPKSGFIHRLYTITQHQAFYLTMVSIIIIDMVNVAFSIVCQYHDDWKDKRNIFRSLNVMFVVLYIMECVAKVKTFSDSIFFQEISLGFIHTIIIGDWKVNWESFFEIFLCQE